MRGGAIHAAWGTVVTRVAVQARKAEGEARRKAKNEYVLRPLGTRIARGRSVDSGN